MPPPARQAVPTHGLDVTPGGTDEDQLGRPYHELDRVIVRLMQYKFDGATAWSPTETGALVDRIVGETGYPADKIAHAPDQLKGTHFKRCWPRAVTRQEAGLLLLTTWMFSVLEV